MLSTTEKAIILSSSILGSVYLFTNALNSYNDIAIKRYNNNIDEIIFVNSITMLFSGFTFGYFTYLAIK